MFRNHHSISVALLGSFLVGCAGEPSATPGTGSVHTATVTSTGPIPPYTAQATELDEAGGQVLAKALRAIDGVEDVDLDLEALQVSVQTKSGQFLYEPQVQGAFASAGVELASFSPPSEALVTVYVVEAAGGGWGGVAKARAAFESLKNVDRLFQSGSRATFSLQPGAWFDERALVDALEANQLTLESFKRERRPRATTTWILGTEPFSWTGSASKVREALMELPHVMDAYASDNVVLHMAAPATIDEREVKALLSALDVEVSSVTRDDAAAF